MEGESPSPVKVPSFKILSILFLTRHFLNLGLYVALLARDRSALFEHRQKCREALIYVSQVLESYSGF